MEYTASNRGNELLFLKTLFTLGAFSFYERSSQIKIIHTCRAESTTKLLPSGEEVTAVFREEFFAER